MIWSKSRGLFLAGILFLAVVLLTVLRPDQEHIPVLEVDDSANGNLELVLQQQSSRAECFKFISKISKQITKSCDSCEIAKNSCTPLLGKKYQKVRGNQALEEYSVRFVNGDMLIKSRDNSSAKVICDQAATAGFGICYHPGRLRGPYNRVANSEKRADDILTFLSSTTTNQDLLNRSVPVFRWVEIICGFFLSLLMTFLTLKTQKFHFRFTGDSIQGVQKIHLKEVSRVGGLSIYLAFLVVMVINHSSDFFGSKFDLGMKLALASLPALTFGLAEDIFKNVGVSARLLATMCSAILAWWLTGVSLNSYDLWVVDKMIIYLPVSVFLMAVAVSGVANAFNIIDGCNGFSSGTAIICLIGLGTLSYIVGDYDLVRLTCLLIGVLLGFFLFNFPHGKIFMGDGGAYFIGFSVAWLAVLLPSRNLSVSPWASLLVCSYPVIETIFSMCRRLLSRAMLGKPDQGHLHNQINKFSSNISFTKFLDNEKQNSMVLVFLLPMLILPVLVSIFNFQNSNVLKILFLAYCGLYCFVYLNMSRMLEKKHS